MSKHEKLLWKFLNKPESLPFKKIELLLLKIGFERIESKGSHIKFKHPRLAQNLIIPLHNNDCKPFYKIAASKVTRQILTAQKNP